MELLLEYGLQVLSALLITLIGVLGTYLTLQLSKTNYLKNVNEAQKELIRSAKITVGELQQTVVNGLKEAHADGRLTSEEIAQLRAQLIEKTIEKLSAPAFALLSAACVDIEGLIIGAGESWIERMKQNAALAA
ncbi:MAG: hypothetical protein R2912_06875 [Eubacteriales bacterium]